MKSGTFERWLTSEDGPSTDWIIVIMVVLIVLRACIPAVTQESTKYQPIGISEEVIGSSTLESDGAEDHETEWVYGFRTETYMIAMFHNDGTIEVWPRRIAKSIKFNWEE